VTGLERDLLRHLAGTTAVLEDLPADLAVLVLAELLGSLLEEHTEVRRYIGAAVLNGRMQSRNLPGALVAGVGLANLARLRRN